MEIEGVGPRDFLLENLMMGLRLAAGIPAAVLRHRFGTGFDDHLAGLWARWTEGGLAEEPGTHLRLTETGRLLLDRLLGEAAEMLSGPGMESIRVSWP
jgi:coproporphyrinogen III oxidase-like Fe-S oxidoreductase